MPNVKILNIIPNIRITRGAAVIYTLSPAKTFAGKGYPIGILLAITYIKAQTRAAITETLSDMKPNVRIINI